MAVLVPSQNFLRAVQLDPNCVACHLRSWYSHSAQIEEGIAELLERRTLLICTAA
jgi:hypothetical protein